MSEQKAEQTSGETGSLGAEPVVAHSSDAAGEPVAAAAPEKAQEAADVKSPDLVPEQGGAGRRRQEAAKAEAPRLTLLGLRPTAPAHSRQAHDHVVG